MVTRCWVTMSQSEHMVTQQRVTMPPCLVSRSPSDRV